MKTVCPKGRMGSNPILSVYYHKRYHSILEIEHLGEVPKLAEGAPLERE